MKAFRVLFSFITTIALVLTFVAAGLALCVQPPTTHVLSTLTADDGTSPFSRTQLVQVADATRDYSFGTHDEFQLYNAIYQVDVEYKDKIKGSGGSLPSDFPKIERIIGTPTLEQLKTAFSGASEMYCYSADTVSHLDDCYRIASIGFPVVIVLLAVAFVGLVFVGVTGRRRWVGGVLLAAGILAILAFIALVAWSIVDFNGFFTTFHLLFFSQGNWQFPYDSLLICSLPTAFWMGMGIVVALVAIILSLISILIGSKLVRRRK